MQEKHYTIDPTQDGSFQELGITPQAYMEVWFLAGVQANMPMQGTISFVDCYWVEIRAVDGKRHFRHLDIVFSHRPRRVEIKNDTGRPVMVWR